MILEFQGMGILEKVEKMRSSRLQILGGRGHEGERGEEKDKEKGLRMTPAVYNLRGQGLILE